MKNLVVITACTLAFGLGIARAEDFAQKHPRRAEVLKRDKNEKRKNAQAFKNGKITKNQEKQLNGQDNAIHQEEHADAAANGGHITKSEQKSLNQQENQVNQERRADEKQDAGN
jgi:hypothetical protein